MTKTCNHHFLVNQEKGEKHVFRKSKKYRTLCSVALGTMVTAVVAWGGAVTHADEVTTSVDTTIQRTENPATNLPEAQPNPVSEQTESLVSTGQSNGAIAVTVPHDTVTQAVEEAKAEGVSTVEDSPMDLGNTRSASETSQQISKAEADAQNQVVAINEVTETYKADKATYESNKARIEQENKELSQAYEGANQTGKETNAWVDTKVKDLKSQYADADVTVIEQVVSSGNGTSVLDYTNYGKTVETIQSTNEQAVADYLTKKTKADDIVAKNQGIQKENEAGLAKAKADNEAIERRNQAGQAAVDAENRTGQAAVDQANQEKQQLVSDRAAEISKGEEGFISEALAQSITVNPKHNMGPLPEILIRLFQLAMLCWVATQEFWIPKDSLSMTASKQVRPLVLTIKIFKMHVLMVKRLVV